MSTTITRCDSARILRSVYRIDEQRLFALHGLAAPTHVGLGSSPAVQSGLAVAVNADFDPPRPGASVIVGGGCVGYSNASLAQLRLDYLTDTVMALAVASLAATDCLIYLPIREEQITAPAAHEGWRAFGDILHAISSRLAATIAAPRSLTIARTDDPSVRSVVARVIARRGIDMRSDDLNTLYSLRPSGKQVTPSEARLQQYRSTIMTYLPEVVGELIGRPVDHVVAAENLHQVKAVSLARSIAEGLRSGRVDHLAHTPAPSLGGTTRMSVAKPDSAIAIMDPPTASALALRRANRTVRSYWQTVWDLHRTVLASPSPPPDLHTMLTFYHHVVTGG